jgi:hypothetical protein
MKWLNLAAGSQLVGKAESGRIGKGFDDEKFGSISSEVINPRYRNGNSVETRSATSF